MNDKTIGGKKWVGLDYNVASDYTHGSPAYYKTLLRQMMGMPIILPGEENENQQSIKDAKRYFNKVSRRGHMPNIFYQG